MKMKWLPKIISFRLRILRHDLTIQKINITKMWLDSWLKRRCITIVSLVSGTCIVIRLMRSSFNPGKTVTEKTPYVMKALNRYKAIMKITSARELRDAYREQSRVIAAASKLTGIEQHTIRNWTEK